MIATMRKLKGNVMKLIKRRPYSNTYQHENGLRSVIGGVPNVPDRNGNLAPMDNEPQIVTDDPRIGILIPRAGLGQVGFHDKATNTYGSILKLYTGESLVRRIKGFPAGAPTINKDKRYIQWNAGQQWVREYVTEKHCKQVIKQADGQAFTEVYKLNGLAPRKNGNQIDFLRNGKKAFSIQRPYYIDPTTTPEEWLGYVPLTWQKVGDDYELSYPAPDASMLRGGYAYIDPTVEFSDRAGGTGTPKDTYLRSANQDRSDGSDAQLYASDVYLPILRFDLSSIPSGATVNSADLTLTNVAGSQAGNNTISIHRLTTDWGVTDTDAGITEDPATGGQATYRRSFDYNGAGGDVTWAGGNYGPGDYAAAETSLLIAGAPAAGATQTWSIPIMTQYWASNPGLNYGLSMISSAAPGRKDFDSSDSVTAAERPYLTVNYTVPFVGKSAIGIGIGIGIGI